MTNMKEIADFLRFMASYMALWLIVMVAMWLVALLFVLAVRWVQA